MAGTAKVTMNVNLPDEVSKEDMVDEEISAMMQDC